MAITTDNPVTVPAKSTPQLDFTEWWITGLWIRADDPNAPVKVGAALSKLARDEYGVGTLLEGSQAQLEITDLFSLAGENSDVAVVVDQLVSVLGALAKSQGVIS